jgi:ADP-ribose pyrophosphatase
LNVKETTIASKTVFKGRAIRVDVLDIEQDSGRPAVREIVRHPGAAVVLARTPDRRFVLVRQYRKAVEREMLEAVAGTLEPGEDPETCARRELEEETGHSAARLARLGTSYPAPGYTEEKLHLFFAETGNSPGRARPEDDERIEVVYATAPAIDAMIAAGDIVDAKTVVAWHLYRAAGSDGRVLTAQET